MGINFEEVVEEADEPLQQREQVQDEFLSLLQQEQSSSADFGDEQAKTSFVFPFSRTIR